MGVLSEERELEKSQDILKFGSTLLINNLNTGQEKRNQRCSVFGWGSRVARCTHYLNKATEHGRRKPQQVQEIMGPRALR